jgi:hypothetical protein
LGRAVTASSWPSPKVLALLVAVLGTAFVGMAGFVSVVAMSLAFDSPKRTTSTALVGDLLLGGVAGEALAVWTAGAGIALRGARASRPTVGAAMAVCAVAVVAHMAALGLAFFGG